MLLETVELEQTKSCAERCAMQTKDAILKNKEAPQRLGFMYRVSQKIVHLFKNAFVSLILRQCQ